MCYRRVENKRTVVYYRVMRYKDENKNANIFHATIQLINENGLAETSMSKIAKRAGVSASTIYIYFENKEDLLNKLYLNVKKRMSQAIFYNLDSTLSVKESFEIVLKRFVDFSLDNKDYFLFMEQFKNSPLLDKVSSDEGVELFRTIFGLCEKGKEEHVLKQIDINLIIIFTFQPIIQLLKEHFNESISINKDNVNMIIRMSWDAIKA